MSAIVVSLPDGQLVRVDLETLIAEHCIESGENWEVVFSEITE